jgi:phosphate transport system substrate-binding protein
LDILGTELNARICAMHMSEHPRRVCFMSVRFPKSLGAFAFAAVIAFSACSSNGATSAPSGATSAPSGGAAIPAPPTGNITLQGAGATFPAPLYNVWIETYSASYPNIKINYTSNGSGAGIKAITQQTVAFGASDAAMADTDIAALPAGTTILHIPTALGAVVMIYNLPGVDGLQLDADTVAGIYLGTITKWNDPRIVALNAGVALPDMTILVAHRSDGSGTTNAFTSYLDTVSPDWHTKVGKGKEVNWPVGVGAAGNDGVAGSVKQTTGGIGYVELNYATTAKLTSAKLKNAAGNFVAGSTDGVTAAANAVVGSFPADFRQAPIINGPGATTYPIASYTYLLVYRDQANADKGRALVSLIAWSLTDGQAMETALGYAPLPAAIQAKALAELHTITAAGQPIWP